MANIVIQPTENKAAALKKYHEFMGTQYAALWNDLMLEVDGAKQQVIQERIAQLDRKMKEVETQLKQINMPEAPEVHAEEEFLNLLPSIDFSQASSFVRKVRYEPDTVKTRAALLLLQNSEVMAGEHCLTRIRTWLRPDTPANFKCYSVAYSTDITPDARSLLARLADHLGLPPPAPEMQTLLSLQTYAQEIINRIIGMMRTGTFVLIEFSYWNALLKKQEFWDWFLPEFWHPLVDALQAAAQTYSKLHIFLIFIVKKSLPDPLPPFVLRDADELHRCVQQACAAKRVIDLPLNRWTQDDINIWLDENRTLFDDNLDFRVAAANIFNESEGMPSQVCEELEQLFKIRKRV